MSDLISRPTAETERLRINAERYEWIRDNLAQMYSPNMDGSYRWRCRNNPLFGKTFDEAIDRARGAKDE